MTSVTASAHSWRGATGDYDIPDVDGFSVLLLTIDALRADHLGVYGYERDTTPNIDRLAHRGLVFRRAYSQAPKTVESMPSLYSGLYPSNIDRDYEHPSVRDKNRFFWVVGERTTLIAERFRKLRYSTGAFSRFASFRWQHLDRGFQHFEAHRGDMTSRVKRFISRADGPFFIAIHYGFPHEPYVRHKRYDFGSKPIDRYDSEIAYTDKLVGRLVRHLKKAKLFKKTVIIVAADHGEEFHEHGGEFHRNQLYEELAHVPLIVVIPGVLAASVETYVELVDVAPLLNELFKWGAQPGEFDGQSLLASLHGQRVEAREGAYSQRYTRRYSLDGGTLRTAKWRATLTASAGSFELYDAENDPKQQVNVADDYPEVSAEFKKRIRQRPMREGESIAEGSRH